MKKVIIAIIVAFIAILVIKSFWLNKKTNAPDGNILPENRVSGFQADENSNFSLNKNSEIVLMDSDSKNSVSAHLPVASGELVVTKGVLTGQAKFSAKKVSVQPISYQNSFMAENALNTSKFSEAVFVLKALVFDRASSTSQNLVYRVDGELTLHGVTQPISLRSNVRFGTNSLDITGVTPIDASSFGMVLPGSGSYNFAISLSGNKK